MLLQNELLIKKTGQSKEDYINKLQERIENMKQSELKALSDPSADPLLRSKVVDLNKEIQTLTRQKD